MGGLLRKFGCSVVLSGALLGSALAADLPTKAQPVVPNMSGPSAYVYGGYVTVPDSWYAYAGAVAGIGHSLSQDGWLFRIGGGDGHYNYNMMPGVGHGADFQNGEAMIGYQAFVGNTHISGYVGANVEDHHNSGDPFAVMKGTKWGVKGQGEIFTELNKDWYVFGLGTISSVWNNYLVMGKAGYNITPTISIGPEVMQLGNVRFDAIRTGPFIAWKVTPFVHLIFSGGYSWDERANSLNDHSGVYGSVYVSAAF
jgi:hypothetical protein